MASVGKPIIQSLEVVFTLYSRDTISIGISVNVFNITGNTELIRILIIFM